METREERIAYRNEQVRKGLAKPKRKKSKPKGERPAGAKSPLKPAESVKSKKKGK